MANNLSPKQTIQLATANLMRDIIKRSRARFAALPQCQKDRIIRGLEDGAAQAAREAA
jgi:hypothetical protein